MEASTPQRRLSASRHSTGTATVSSDGHLDLMQFSPEQDPSIPPDEDSPKRHGQGPMIRNLIDFTACNPSSPRSSPGGGCGELDATAQWVPVRQTSRERPARRIKPEAVGGALAASRDAELRREVLLQWQSAVRLERQQAHLEELQRENAALEERLAALRLPRPEQLSVGGQEEEAEAQPMVQAPHTDGALAECVSGESIALPARGQFVVGLAWHGFLALWTGVALALRMPRLALPTVPFWIAGVRLLGLPLPLLSDRRRFLDAATDARPRAPVAEAAGASECRSEGGAEAR